MSFMGSYSWKQAWFSVVVLLLGSMFIFMVQSKDSISPAWDNFFMFIIPASFTVCFLPVVIVEKVITPIQLKFKKK